MSSGQLVLRADVRRRWRAWLGLVLILGVTVGALITATAGARRTSGGFDQFIAEARPADFTVGVSDGQAAEEIRSTAGVARVGQVGTVPAHPWLVVDARLLEPPTDATIAVATGGTGVDFERFSILEGRRARPGAPEALVNDAFAEQVGVGVGDRMQLVTFPEDVIQASRNLDGLSAAYRDDPGIGHAMEVTIVGRGLRASDLVRDDASRPAYILLEHDTTARWLAMAPAALDDAAFRDGHQVVVQVDEGVDPASVLAAIEPLIDADVVELSVLRDDVEEATRPYVVALIAFAVLAGLATVVVVGTALFRQSVADASDDAILASLGASRHLLSYLAATRAAAIGMLGTVVAIGVSTPLSALFPIGPAAAGLPGRGVHLDAAITAIVGACTVAGSIAIGVVASRRATTDHRHRTSAAAGERLRRPLPLAWAVGHRLAFPPPGNARLVLRSTLVALVAALIGAGAVTVFASSLDDLFEHPQRHGWTWDFALTCNQGYCDLPLDITDVFRATPGIEGWTFVNYGLLDLSGARLPVVAAGYGRGTIEPFTMLEGRPPSADHEVALGTETMGDLGVGIGDSLRTTSGMDLRVVGRTVFTGLGQADSRRASLGEGAAMTIDGLSRLAGRSNLPDAALIAVRGDAVPAERAIEARTSGRETLEMRRPAALAAWPDLRAMPLLLGLLLGVLALGTLAHGLWTSTRLVRRDLSVLHAIGMSRAALTRVVLAQTVIVVATALVIGIPIGVLAGLFAWHSVTARIGVASAATVSPIIAVIAIGAIVGAACTVAVVPAAGLRRRIGTSALRAE